jgi:hypothetical protein
VVWQCSLLKLRRRVKLFPQSCSDLSPNFGGVGVRRILFHGLHFGASSVSALVSKWQRFCTYKFNAKFFLYHGGIYKVLIKRSLRCI